MDVFSLLDTYVPNPKIPLRYQTPFELLIAIVLSAQCTDAMVNQVTENLFAVYPTADAMSRATVEDIKKYIFSCGLSTKKAFFLREIAHEIVHRFAGMVPLTFKELESLPGVGHKTASCIMAHIAGIPTFPVDTHVFRLAHRFNLSKGKTVAAVEKDLKQIVPKQRWIRTHLQMVLYGRMYCTAVKHSLEKCPICAFMSISHMVNRNGEHELSHDP